MNTVLPMEAKMENDKENLLFVEEHLAELLREPDVVIRGFGRSIYGGSFDAYRSAHAALLNEIVSLADKMDSRDAAASAVADFFVVEAEKLKAGMPNKPAKEKLQLDLNMLMAAYVLPSILEESKDATYLTDAICEKWGKTFKNSKIKASTYNAIEEGFRFKLCYVTTAVCNGLHKPADCHELTVLKKYRDNYLLHIEGGKELVEEYYDIAPTIVKRIEKSADAEAKYQYILEKYISPCVNLIEADKKEECKKVYIDMVNTLKREYMEEYQA